MPISPIVLQRRHAELGRIRLGDKGDRGQPQKLNSFRFTSPSEAYIRDLAEIYGGTPQPWDNKGKAEWQLYTTATSIPVIAVKGGLSQWMETWSGGGCVHRCDGEVDVLTGDQCDDGDPNHRNAKPTTRLSLMLPELDAIGVWRMESHGWNAAAEIPAVAELAQYVGDLVPAYLHLVERRKVKDGRTSRFVVPVLDLRIGQARLREVVAAISGGGAPALEAPVQSQAPAIEAPARPTGDPVPSGEEVPLRLPSPEQVANADLEQATAMLTWLQQRVGDGHPATEAVRARITVLSPEQPDADGIVEADVVEEPTAPPADAAPPSTTEPDPDAVWQQILAAGSEKGMDLDAVLADFREVMSIIPDEASGAEMASYLHTLTTGQVA